jgi:hypothetical protein
MWRKTIPNAPGTIHDEKKREFENQLHVKNNYLASIFAGECCLRWVALLIPFEGQYLVEICFTYRGITKGNGEKGKCDSRSKVGNGGLGRTPADPCTSVCFYPIQ